MAVPSSAPAAAASSPAASSPAAAPDDDADDLAAARGGDAVAFGRIIRRHQRRLFAVLVRRMGSVSDAEDVLQNTCLLAWRKLDQFRGEAKLSTWLTRIALTQAASHTRRAGRRQPRPSLDALAQGSAVPDPAPTPAADAEARDEARHRRAAIERAIGQLPADQRDVVVLKEFDQRSYQEIAAIIDCPVGTVRSRLHRARQELATRLAPLLDRPAAAIADASSDRPTLNPSS